MKIRTKIFIYVILPIFLADIGITAFNAFSNYNTLKTLSEAKFIADTELIAARISTENARGVAVSKAAAEAASILFGKRPESVLLIKDILGEFPMYAGASIGYEVNADLADFKTEQGLKNLRDGRDVTADGGIDAYNFLQNKTGVSMDEWIAKSEGGRFVAYWNRAKGELALEPLMNMDTAMYSAGLRKKMESGDKEAYIVTEPYLYSTNVMMVEYSSPIFFDGKFSGQVAFDRDLANMSSMVNSMKTLKGEDIFLVSAQGRIISATKNENLRTLSIDDLLTDESGNFSLALLRDENGQLVRDELNLAKNDPSKYKTTYRDMLKSAFETSKNSIIIDSLDKSVTYYRDPQIRKTFCVSQSLIKPGNWVVVHVVPEAELFAPIYRVLFGELAGAAVFFLVMIIALFFVNGMLSRVAQSTRIAEEISKGNFRVNVSSVENSGDETGRLLRAIAKMASKLRAFFLQMKFTGINLNESTSEIEKISENYEESIREFINGVSAIFAAVKQMNEASGELCETADTLSETAANSAQRASEGRRRISEMESTMGVFSKSTSAVSRRLAIISERAANINTVVTAISKVAEETNLLSLNASIEAEKAGSYGVGFAVVAREIGRLAEQTANAADDIENIVKDMQNAVASGVSEMDKFAEEIRTGGADIGRLISDMDEVATKMQSIAPQVERLSGGIQSQRFDLSKIGDSISGLGDGLKQASALLKEVAATRVQLRDSVEKLTSEMSLFDTDSKGEQ